MSFKPCLQTQQKSRRGTNAKITYPSSTPQCSCHCRLPSLARPILGSHMSTDSGKPTSSHTESGCLCTRHQLLVQWSEHTLAKPTWLWFKRVPPTPSLRPQNPNLRCFWILFEPKPLPNPGLVCLPLLDQSGAGGTAWRCRLFGRSAH